MRIDLRLAPIAPVRREQHCSPSTSRILAKEKVRGACASRAPLRLEKTKFPPGSSLDLHPEPLSPRSLVSVWGLRRDARRKCTLVVCVRTWLEGNPPLNPSSAEAMQDQSLQGRGYGGCVPIQRDWCTQISPLGNHIRTQQAE